MTDTNKRKPVRPTPPGAERPLIRDREAAYIANVGLTKFAEIQREPGFPPPVWLGPRSKRHDRSRLLDWLSSRRSRA